MKRIAVAPGDPAGIGYEISAKALMEMRNDFSDISVVVYAQKALWQRACEQFAPGLKATCIDKIESASECGQIYLIDSGEGFDLNAFVPGKLQAQSARCAHLALQKIIADAKAGALEGICTGPIHKGAMRLAHVEEIGHTEILARGFGVENPMTLFITKGLRIFFYSRHLSLREAIEVLDEKELISFGKRMNEHMRQLGFNHPHLAMAALNPHASDGGQFGHEESEILIPAAKKLQSEGVDITEPIGADSVFSQAAKGRYDAVLSLYHDQGHIAAKTYDFERTISATLGLPILRTSVDHGTAFDIAWKGVAQSLSMRTALEVLIKHI